MSSKSKWEFGKSQGHWALARSQRKPDQLQEVILANLDIVDALVEQAKSMSDANDEAANNILDIAEQLLTVNKRIQEIAGGATE